MRAAELFEHSEGVLDIGDIEHLHDMRVATRRLRAALEIFKPCFPRKRFKAALKSVKSLADILGERRDRDVSIVILEEFAADVGEEDRLGVETLIASLREEQSHANEALRPHLTADRLKTLRKKLDELVEGARERVPLTGEATR
jgi:CHAD domain-containing protein